MLLGKEKAGRQTDKRGWRLDEELQENHMDFASRKARNGGFSPAEKISFSKSLTFKSHRPPLELQRNEEK